MTTMTPNEQHGAAARRDWTPESWKSRPAAQAVEYDDPAEVEAAVARLRELPPLVTSYEIERLKSELAEAGRGERFILQGGDCAETLADCRREAITSKLKILLQMSLVLVHGLKRPVTRVGRFAGQYAKPRSTPTETVDGVELPSYFGDMFNEAAFDAGSRRFRPDRMVAAYQHSAMTLNFIRSLLDGGFADLHHPGHWNLKFMEHAGLSPERRTQYEAMTATLADGLRFMEALGETKVEEFANSEFYTSHEGLNLLYESAQTVVPPRRGGYYDLTTHLPWIGERTRQADGAHVEFFRGVENPIGVKIGPAAEPADVIELVRILNPASEPGKLVLIARMGARHVGERLPGIVREVAASGEPVVWVCDPMHGNGIKTAGGVKTRSFDDILSELEETVEVHRRAGTVLGGVHFELTGEDVTECIGGAGGPGEDELGVNYASLCDPRLNYAQSLELAFLLAGALNGG